VISESRTRVGKVRWIASLRVGSPDVVSWPAVFIWKDTPPNSLIVTFLLFEDTSIIWALVHSPPFCILTGSLLAIMACAQARSSLVADAIQSGWNGLQLECCKQYRFESIGLNVVYKKQIYSLILL